MGMEGYKLFLDDERNPADCIGFYGFPKDLYQSDDWVIARSYRDFVFTIAEQWTMKGSCPVLISFDHDLGEDKSGKDCANWLVKHCLETNMLLPNIIVHSRNNVGVENIGSLLNQFQQVRVEMNQKEADEMAILKTIIQFIRVPQLGKQATEEATIMWQKKIGETIDKGDILAEIETSDKTFNLESYSTGVLLFKGIEDRSKLKVDDILAVIGLYKQSEK